MTGATARTARTDRDGVPGARVFYAHIQKTAGTALRRRLRNHFGEQAIYPDPSDGPDILTAVVSTDHLLARMRARGDQIEVVTGHFPLCTTELLGGRWITLTVLREPVERTVSYLRHHRQVTKADRDRSMEEIYADPLRFRLAHNPMVTTYSLTVDEMTEGILTEVEFDRARLERAKERLAAVDVVGLQEDFGGFCAELTRRFGWDLGPPVRANESEVAEVSDAFREQLASDNAADCELYAYAVDLVARRRAAATTAC